MAESFKLKQTLNEWNVAYSSFYRKLFITDKNVSIHTFIHCKGVIPVPRELPSQNKLDDWKLLQSATEFHPSEAEKSLIPLIPVSAHIFGALYVGWIELKMSFTFLALYIVVKSGARMTSLLPTTEFWTRNTVTLKEVILSLDNLYILLQMLLF